MVIIFSSKSSNKSLNMEGRAGRPRERCKRDSKALFAARKVLFEKKTIILKGKKAQKKRRGGGGR